MLGSALNYDLQERIMGNTLQLRAFLPGQKFITDFYSLFSLS